MLSTNYAQIINGRVENVIVCDNYEMANVIARACYGAEAFAVDITYCDAAIGDTYENGFFYRTISDTNEKQQIKYRQPVEIEVEELKATNKALEEENKRLKEKISYTELAILDIYEASISNS